MGKLLAWMLLILTLEQAHAAELRGSVNAGLGAATAKYSDEPPFDALTPEYEDGRVIKFQGAVESPSGWMVRARYSNTRYARLTAIGLLIAEDVRERNAQVGFFYAPPDRGRFGYRAGAGLQYMNRGLSQDGLFLEADLLINAARFLSFDAGLAVTSLDRGGGSLETDGRELHLDAIFHVGAADITLGGRYGVDLVRERFVVFGTPFRQEHEEKRPEVSLTIGTSWGATRMSAAD